MLSYNENCLLQSSQQDESFTGNFTATALDRSTGSPDSLQSETSSDSSSSIMDALESLQHQAAIITDTKSDLEKPEHSYIALISMAILSSKENRMILGDIYDFIMKRFPYYNNQQKAWRNSIRHNLSINECFIKSGRSDNGKGNYWSIHPACAEDFSKGDFRRRQARRRARKSVKNINRYQNSAPANVGYVRMTSSYLGHQPLTFSPNGCQPMTSSYSGYQSMTSPLFSFQPLASPLTGGTQMASPFGLLPLRSQMFGVSQCHQSPYTGSELPVSEDFNPDWFRNVPTVVLPSSEYKHTPIY